jgi:uncharacterized protein (TIGR02117 family)
MANARGIDVDGIKVLKFLCVDRKAMLKVIFFIILLLVTACVPSLQVIKNDSAIVGEQAIYVISHGWHTGFIIPVQAIETVLPKLKTRFPNTHYIELGWGDKGFYQSQEITTGLTLRALFWSAGSVVHAVAVPDNIAEFFSHSEIEKLCLSEQSYAALIAFIADSFKKDRHSEIITLKNGIYGDSQFYEGAGNYHLLNTCNKWVAKGLASTGMDIDPMFKLTAGSIMDIIKNHKQSLGMDVRQQRGGACYL